MASPGFNLSSVHNEDRRTTQGWTHIDRYKPDREKERDRDRDIQQDRSPIRRESREARDSRDSRDLKGNARDARDSNKYSARDPRLDTAAPRNLRVETNISGSPRGSTSLNNSPASSRNGLASARQTPIQPVFEKSFPASATPAASPAMDSFRKMDEISKERNLLQHRKGKQQDEGRLSSRHMNKLESKANDFPPYSEFGARFQKSDSELDKQISAVDQKYHQSVKEFISAVESQAAAALQKQVAPSKDDLVAALEKKFDEFTRQATQKQQQMEDTWNKTTQSNQEACSALETKLQSLTTEYGELGSKFETLQSEHASRSSENAALKEQINDLKLDLVLVIGKIATAESRIDSLPQSAVSDTDFTQTKSAVEHLTTIVSNQADASRMFKENLSELSVKGQALANDSNRIEVTVQNLKAKVDNVDWNTIDEVSDAWIDHDLRGKIFSHETSIKSIEATTQALRRDLQSLQPAQDPIVQPSQGSAPSNQDFEALIDQKVKAVEQFLRGQITKYGENMDDTIGQMIEDLEGRVSTIETARASTQGQPGALAQDPNIDARIANLEAQSRLNANALGPVSIHDIAERITVLEENKLGHRIDRIDLKMGEVIEHLRTWSRDITLLDSRVTEHAAALNGKTAAFESTFQAQVKVNLEELHARVETVEQGVRSLNFQWSNMTTKQMAETILVQLTPHALQTEARIHKVESQMQQVRTSFQQYEQGYADYIKNVKRVNDLLKAYYSAEKRTASPDQSVDEATKKRKLGLNGRHSPMPQQRNGSASHSVQRPSSPPQRNGSVSHSVQRPPS
ncbi:Uu.00g066070.m01.CDS01 [Anthostomella pinea]|uniref:Uu.00g066070.m01.CDS01 n=1 Tax=Anthostomella pinea TaxID=933095 RepID=A0AAI8YKU8_9PEZI|nr:Uu.00g066070.m01.CDS01 [Anthostomella pinea]